jgi:hypothetical protein
MTLICSEIPTVHGAGAGPAQARALLPGRRMRLPQHLEFFSLGGLVANVWKPQVRVLPWVGAAAALMLLSCWDVFRGAGRIDLIVMGLAGYELVIGLTEDPAAQLVQD